MSMADAIIMSTRASAASSATMPAENFLHGEIDQPLQRLHKAQVFHLVTAGKEECAECSGIIMTTLLKCQENIATHGNGDMANYAVIITKLHLSFQVKIVLHHFEEHLDIPSFAIDADDLFVRQINPGGQNRQSLAFLVAVANENDFHLLSFSGFRRHTGKDLGLARAFSQQTIQPAQLQPLAFVAIKHIGHILGHTDHRHMFTESGKKCWEIKPAVHKDRSEERRVGKECRSRWSPYH